MSFGKEVTCAVCGRRGSSLSMAFVPDGKGGQTFVCRKGFCKDTWINDYLHRPEPDYDETDEHMTPEEYEEMVERIRSRNRVLRPDEDKNQGYTDWEQKVNRFLSQDSRDIYQNLTKPVKACLHAIDQMVAVDGKSIDTTHGGLSGYIIKRDYGIDKWDKNHEYRHWLLESMLDEETETPMTEDEWMAVEAYAVDSTINDKLIQLGNLFRKQYQECSKKNKCIEKEIYSDGSSTKIDNVCRKKCLEEAAEKTQYFTSVELEERRKRLRTFL